MGSQPTSAVPSAGRARALAGLALVATLATPGLLTWLWSRPMPAAPLEVPALSLPADEVAAQRARDVHAAAQVPSSDAVHRRLSLYRESNRAELEANDGQNVAERRRRWLIGAIARVEAEHGAEAVEAIRAADVAHTMDALAATRDDPDRGEELGRFVEMLERYGMVRRGRQVAPAFVVRTVAKARWNAMHGRPLTATLGPLERRAYWGWLALAAEGAPILTRIEAVERYAEAGGPHAEEARGVLELRADHPGRAADAFEAAYAEHPSFRLRNHALFASLR